MNHVITDSEIEAYLLNYRLNNSENDFRRLTGKIEASLANNIRQGNYRALMNINLIKREKHIGIVAISPKKQYEYITVAGITLFARNAIKGGATPDSSYDLSDVFLQKLETCKTVDEINHLFTLAAVLFAKLVYNSNRTQKPYIIEQIKIYISRNIFKKIRLKDLAGYISTNASYLSHTFTKSEGITLHEYIQKEKIEVSCNLLKYSDVSISVISEYMGFGSQSNFTSIFKKWVGITPSIYRNRYFHENFE